MIIINREDIILFARKHPLVRKPLSRWVNIVEAAHWKNIVDIQRNFRAAEDVKGYIIFNIHGNDFRIITVVRYEKKQVMVHELFTHSQYDRWQPCVQLDLMMNISV